MPGEPGYRHIGGVTHASDSPRCLAADTPRDMPCDRAASVPMSTWTVGGTTYVHVAGNERRTNQ